MKIALLVLITAVCGWAQGVAYTVDSDGLATLTVNGGANLADATLELGNGACVSWDGGSCTGGGSWGSSSSSNSGTVFVQRTYTDGTSNFTVRVEYTGATTNTFTQTILITNNSATLTCRPALDLFGIDFGVSPTLTGTTTGAAWSGGPPMGKAVFESVGLYYWYTPLSSPISLAFNNYSADKYRLTMETLQNVGVGAGTATSVVSIAPLGTLTVVAKFRFGSTSENAITFAPEPYANMSAFAPYATPGADRRPVARLILSSSASRDASTNPRGWTFGTDPIGDPTQFRTAAIAKVDAAIALADAQAVRPSTIIVWDIEGQEFDHALSYVGYPSRLPQMAPEMDAIADELIARIKAAGYAVGLTIRPNTFQIGTSLPGSCTYNANPEFSDIYIKTDEAPPYRGYICYDAVPCGGTGIGPWCQEGPWKPGSQKTPDNLTDIQVVMSEKISYALSRWGVQKFYIDSNGQAWRSLYANLSAAFPNVLFFPEHRAAANYAFQSAYSGEHPNTEWATPVDVAAVWPSAWIAVVPYTEPVLNAKLAAYIAGTAQGSSGIYDVGSGSYWAVTGVTSVQQSAAAMNATVVMTDRGQVRTFPSTPGTSFTYPTTARVYFAATAAALTSSTTYCTRRAFDYCYLNGVLQPTAALDLSNRLYYQIRYYDFAGGLVSNNGIARKLRQ